MCVCLSLSRTVSADNGGKATRRRQSTGGFRRNVEEPALHHHVSNEGIAFPSRIFLLQFSFQNLLVSQTPKEDLRVMFVFVFFVLLNAESYRTEPAASQADPHSEPASHQSSFPGS